MTYASRVPLALVFGFILTTLFFWALQQSVHSGFVIPEPRTPVKWDFTDVRPEATPPPPRVEPVERRLPPALPPGPAIRIEGGKPGSGGFVQPSSQSRPAFGDGIKPLRADGEPVPLIRVMPDYPPRPARLGIEGFVVVQFTISALGSVADAVVVEAAPAGAFEQAALRAIARWRYNPQVIDGQAVERRGVRVKLSFTLDD